MKKYWSLLIPIVLVINACTNKKTEMLKFDFEGLPDSMVSEDIYMNTLGRYKSFVGYGVFERRLGIEKEAKGNVLAVNCEPFNSGPKAGLALITMLEPTDEITLSYRVKFDKDFDFCKGGKLLGVSGGEKAEDGKMPEGDDGWVCRFVFNEDQTASFMFFFPHEFESTYYPLMSGGKPIQFEPGKWYNLQMSLKINTPGKGNGLITCKMNNIECLSLKDVDFKDCTGLSINQLTFGVFYNKYSLPQKKEKLFIDDVCVVK